MLDDSGGYRPPVCGQRRALNMSLYLSPNYHNLALNCEIQGDAAAQRLALWPRSSTKAVASARTLSVCSGSSERKWMDVEQFVEK